MACAGHAHTSWDCHAVTFAAVFLSTCVQHMHSCEPDPDPRVSSIFSVVMNHKKWPTNRWGLVCDNTQPVEDYTCVHLHPLHWSSGVHAYMCTSPAAGSCL